MRFLVPSSESRAIDASAMGRLESEFANSYSRDALMRITSKGQVTIPVEILALTRGDD